MTKNYEATIWVPANERFKSHSGDWMAIGVIAAVFAHGALFTFFPDMNAEDVGFRSDVTGARPSDIPAYIYRDVEPRLTNGPAMERVLEQRYPSRLREAGIGGTVVLYVFVDTEGRPAKSEVKQSSGYPQLDAAAAAVVVQMRFSPAMNRDKPVGVWVLQKVDFRAK